MNLNHISIFSGLTTVDESCWKALQNPGQFVAKRLGCRKRTCHDLPIGTPKSLVSAAEKSYPNKHIKYSFLKVAKTEFSGVLLAGCSIWIPWTKQFKLQPSQPLGYVHLRPLCENGTYGSSTCSPIFPRTPGLQSSFGDRGHRNLNGSKLFAWGIS